MSAAHKESTRRAAMLALLTVAGCAAVGGAAWHGAAKSTATRVLRLV